MSLSKEIKQTVNSPQHEAVLNIVYTANFLEKISRAFFKRFDLTEAQYNMMVVIRLEARKMTQVEISERMVSSRANITSLIDKLEKKKFVKRVPVTFNRRILHIELTEKGMKKLEEVEPEYINAVEIYTEEMNKEESKNLSRLLVKIRNSFKSKQRIKTGK